MPNSKIRDSKNKSTQNKIVDPYIRPEPLKKAKRSKDSISSKTEVDSAFKFFAGD